MKKVLLFIILLLIPKTVDAYYCNYNLYNSTLKKAQNVNIMTSYEIVGDIAAFNIRIYNLQPYQYIIDEKNGITYYYNEAVDGILTIHNVTQPMVYKFGVYSTENYCDTNALATLYVEIPTYNKYYKDTICKGIESYKLCQKWSSINMTYDEFKKNVNDYKENLNSKQEIINEHKNIYETILEFYLQYYYLILPIIVVIGGVLILIIKKRENKFNL